MLEVNLAHLKQFDEDAESKLRSYPGKFLPAVSTCLWLIVSSSGDSCCLFSSKHLLSSKKQHVLLPMNSLLHVLKVKRRWRISRFVLFSNINCNFCLWSLHMLTITSAGLLLRILDLLDTGRVPYIHTSSKECSGFPGCEDYRHHCCSLSGTWSVMLLNCRWLSTTEIRLAA